MRKHENKQRFSAEWCTLTQLGAYFCMTAREVGQKLTELGLRSYDETQGAYVPAAQALVDDLCISMPLRNKKPYYMWHRQKVVSLLQAKLQMKALSDQDVKLREMALALIQIVKVVERESDTSAYFFLSSIEAEQRPTVIAWALIEAHHVSEPMYRLVAREIYKEELMAIQQELSRLGSTLHLSVSEDFNS